MSGGGPGLSRPRPEKGLAIMRRLAGMTGPMANRVEIMAATAARLPDKIDGPRLRSQPAGLDRAAYLQCMAECDLVLLPYDRAAYRERTSGIFVEAVVALRPPLVTAGTWMAGELEHHDLQDLIVDWEAPDLPSTIVSLAGDPSVGRRLQAMQAAYLETHGLAAYARALQTLYTHTAVRTAGLHAHHV